MSLYGTGIGTDVRTTGLEAARHAGLFAAQSAWNVHIQADMSDPAPADTFTYEPGCRCPGSDAG